MWKPSFLRNIADSFEVEEYEEEFVDTHGQGEPRMGQHISLRDDPSYSEELGANGDYPTSAVPNPVVGELHVDVYQTPEEIVVRTMIPGISPQDIDIALTREMLTISGSREEVKEVTEDNYFSRELAWGSFSRTISLPAEVEVDEADAEEQHGVLTIRLPKINKDRQTKVKVKTK